MLPPRRGIGLALSAAALLAGCSSTGRAPFGGGPNSRSVAVIGDHPSSSATGEPGARVATETEEIDLAAASSPRARISGRVLDDQGRPVADARVRLADGVAKGGRDIRASTDRSGAFTLKGLRPGTTYTLIAETDDDRGAIRGSVEAQASDTGVEISLAGHDGVAEPRTARPSRARPISGRSEHARDEEAADTAGEDVGEPTATNREDLGPPVAEASRDETGSGGRRGPTPARLSPPIPGSGWRRPGAPAEDGSARQTAHVPSRSGDRNEEDEPEGRIADPDEGPDPLPPAIERGEADPEQTSTRPAKRTKVGATGPGDAGSMTLAAASPGSRRPESRSSPEIRDADPAPADPPAPSPGSDTSASPNPLASAAPDLPTSAPEPSAEPGGPAPPEMPALASATNPTAKVDSGPTGGPSADPPPDSSPLTPDANPHPASEPVFASEGQAQPPAPPAPTPAPASDYNPFSNPFVTQAANHPSSPKPPTTKPSRAPAPSIAMDVKPTSAPVPMANPPAPAPAPAPARKATWGEIAGATPIAPAANREAKLRPKGKARVVSDKAVSDKKEEAVDLCTYDPRLHKLVDFRLPDLAGDPVRLKELDADYVLLDFWGTWCKPCLDAVPHLVELQKRFGPDRLKVVGIACEQVDPKERRAKVEEAARKLGINYAVLLSGMGGPCPLQEALHIQAFPTMVLLDRSGTIVWRDQGATPATLARLDRVLAAGAGRADTVRR